MDIWDKWSVRHTESKNVYHVARFDFDRYDTEKECFGVLTQIAAIGRQVFYSIVSMSVF